MFEARALLRMSGLSSLACATIAQEGEFAAVPYS